MGYRPKPNDKAKAKKFIDSVYLTCGYCGYNNERERLKLFNCCLKCHRPLGDSKYFKEQLLKKMEGNK